MRSTLGRAGLLGSVGAFGGCAQHEAAAVGVVGASGGESVMAVQCSECGKDLRKLEGGLFQQIPDMEQWFGNVCVQCGRVYCGSPTKPAQRMVLREIGKAP